MLKKLKTLVASYNLPYRDALGALATLVGSIAIVYFPALEPLREILPWLILLGTGFVVSAGKPSDG